LAKAFVYYLYPGFITSFAETLAAVADAGITAITMTPEMGDIDMSRAEDVRRAKRVLADLGISSPGCHGLWGASHDLNQLDGEKRKAVALDHKRQLSHAGGMGCKTYVVHPGMRLPETAVAVQWDAVRDMLDQLVPHAESIGVVIAVENGNPGCLDSCGADLAELARSCDSPFLRLCFDSGHANVAEDAVSTFDAMAPYLATTHLHDNDGNTDQHAIPGTGSIDWDLLAPKIRACKTVIHNEGEAFNREGWTHKRLYAHYREMFVGSE